MKPSHYQTAIYDAVSTIEGNLLIEAVAGSGKTTTLLGCDAALPRNLTRIFLAFNKGIAEELETRGVYAKTFHSLGFAAISKASRVKVNKHKFSDCRNRVVPEDLRDNYDELSRLVSLGKNFGIGIVEPNTRSSWQDIINNSDLTFPNDAIACEYAQRILTLSHSNIAEVDFDDMLYLPVLRNLDIPHVDVAFVDEAQDLNTIQLRLLDKLTPKHIVFVGDSRQAIYAFRGAATSGMNDLRQIYDCVEYPLSVCYRCSKSVVELAKSVVHQIEPCDTAELGQVVYLKENETPLLEFLSTLTKAAIVCRNKRPLFAIAYKLLAMGVPVQVIGLDILKAFQKQLAAYKVESIDAAIEALSIDKDKKIAELVAKNRFNRIDFFTDKFNSLTDILLAAAEKGLTYKEVPRYLQTFFDDKPNALRCSTIHKAKGLEWDNVVFLDEDLIPSKYARTPEALQQENNLWYVAVTRAKRSLYFASSSTIEE